MMFMQQTFMMTLVKIGENLNIENEREETYPKWIELSENRFDELAQYVAGSFQLFNFGFYSLATNVF